MTCRTITTQAELDTAITDANVTCVHVESAAGVWIRIDDENRNRRYQIAGSATVERVDGSATVKRATGTAVLHRVDGEATVDHAGAQVAVYLYSAQATVNGGHVIDLTQLDLKDPQSWCDYHGVNVRDDGQAVLYKALDDDLTAGREWNRPTVYAVGSTVVCDDWIDNHDCGGGLHLSPHPMQALDYNGDARRFVLVLASVESLRPILDGTPKCKVPSCLVEVEVDRWAEPLPVPESAAMS